MSGEGVPTILVVTGSRRRLNERDHDLVKRIVGRELDGSRGLVAVGDATGVDALVYQLARQHPRWKPRRFEADWRRHGSAAGPLRNEEMCVEAGRLAQALGARVVALAFPDPESTGTWDCVRRMARRGWRPAVAGIGERDSKPENPAEFDRAEVESRGYPCSVDYEALILGESEDG